jgi:hypothetical protein
MSLYLRAPATDIIDAIPFCDVKRFDSENKTQARKKIASFLDNRKKEIALEERYMLESKGLPKSVPF